MKLVASKKLSLVHGEPSMDQTSIAKAFMSGSSLNTKLILDEKELKPYIDRQTAMGFICHVFDYAESFRMSPVTKNFKAVA